MKLSVGKAWDETKDFLAREGRLVAPVALATFALPSVLIGWAYPGTGPGSGGGTGLLLLFAMLLAVMVGQMTDRLARNRLERADRRGDGQGHPPAAVANRCGADRLPADHHRRDRPARQRAGGRRA